MTRSTLMVLLRVTFAVTMAKSVVRRFGRDLSVSRSVADQFGVTGVVALADAVDEGTIGFEAVEIPAPPATEPLVEADLDMAVGGLDAAVLIGPAGIVAGGL